MEKVFPVVALLMMLAVPLFLTGCNEDDKAVALDAAQAAILGRQLTEAFEVSSRAVLDNMDKFTPDQQQKLLTINQDLLAIAEQVKQATETVDGATVILRFGSIKYIYSIAHDNYLAARGIIETRYDLFSPAQRLTLRAFDEDARQLDDLFADIETHQESVRRAEAVAGVARLTINLGKIIIPMVVAGL